MYSVVLVLGVQHTDSVIHVNECMCVYIYIYSFSELFSIVEFLFFNINLFILIGG